VSLRYLITGGAGFIGSAVVRQLTRSPDVNVLVVDKLTYAGNLLGLVPVAKNPRYQFLCEDICNRSAMLSALLDFKPDIIMHLAAETHVDRSIVGPADFIQTNIVGSYILLDAALEYWKRSLNSSQENFKFHHVSTDEVFGSLEVGSFHENSPYRPNSPYSASKASSDHLVRAWHRTYGLPVVISNCSNNYGPYQYPDKLIPYVIRSALNGQRIPLYGDGTHRRDWLYVDDHVRALCVVARRGRVGESYNIGGNSEIDNLSLVVQICSLLDELAPSSRSQRYRDLISFVQDRPGHDFRYSVSTDKIANELGWHPQDSLVTGLRKTVIWYLEHRSWLDEMPPPCEPV